MHFSPFHRKLTATTIAAVAASAAALAATMSPRRSPSKLLEINLISAHDLPPVSKTLRTFAVAYVAADHKLTTKTDHRGHTNPSWNYKMLFHVDKDFLKQESSTLTVEIYNLAWLRDLPIGTARLRLNTLSPPLAKNAGYRRISLPVSQPSGHLKGTVNLGIQLVDMADDISLSSLRICDDEESVATKTKKINENSLKSPEEEKRLGPEIESVCSMPESKYTSEPETRTIASGGSIFSAMRPLPSEVATGLKRGIYDVDAAEYGSSIFENWTEGGDRSDIVPPENGDDWAAAAEKELIPLTSELVIDYRQEKNNGLFKCFSNLHGFEFTFVCGANEFRLKKKMKSLNKPHHRAHSDGNLGRFYSS